MKPNGRTLLQLVILQLVFFTLFLSSARFARADENFDTSLKTTYQVQTSGITTIRHEFRIENKQPLLNISQYGLKISSPNIFDVSVIENGKELLAEVVTTNNQTSIGITFPEPVVGQGKARTFELRYNDPDAAIISGKVIEVAIPMLQNREAYDSYQVELITPASYGPPTRVTPANYTSRTSQTQVTTSFDRLDGESVVALFGDEQLFDLAINYHLENPNNAVRLTQIALPPDSLFQRVVIDSLEPRPEKIETDQDGNWIATYLLPPNQVTTVKLVAQAQLSLQPNNEVPQIPPSKSLSNAQEFWPTNDPLVQNAVQDLNTAEDIYHFVVDTLSYNYNRIGNSVDRLGAAQALANPDQALCQEFTDVFVTLARAKDIPSRRITGYAHTENSVLRPLSLVDDILHAWPEYFAEEKQQWIPIDPTWDNTSGGINYFDQFDLNHIVFAINGTSSQTPYPAGSYKTQQQTTKDIEVAFSTQKKEPELDVSIQPTKFSLFNGLITLPVTTGLTITNNTGKALYQYEVQVSLSDPDVVLSSPAIMVVTTLLPYQSVTLPIVVQNLTKPLPSTTTITTSDAIQQQELTISTYPAIWRYFSGPEVLVTLGVGLLIIAIITGGVLVFRRK